LQFIQETFEEAQRVLSTFL